MKIKKLVIEFVTLFTLAFVTVTLVTFLWIIIGHAESAVDWETSFRFAIIFGIILTWGKSREPKKNGVIINLNQQKEVVNEKNHCIHSHFHSAYSLHSTPGSGS